MSVKKKHTNQIHVYNIPFPVFVQRKLKNFNIFLQENYTHIYVHKPTHKPTYIYTHKPTHIYTYKKSRKIKILLLKFLLMLFYILVSGLTYSILLRIALTITVYVVSTVC